MDREFEHGSHDPQTDVTGDDPILTEKIALAHIKEFPDHYKTPKANGGSSRPRLTQSPKFSRRSA